GQSSSLALADGPDPDVAEPDRLAVILERKRQPVGVGLVGRAHLMAGGSQQRHVLLDQDAVVQHRHACRRDDLAGAVKPGPTEDDVITLPRSRRQRGIDQWRILAVYRAGLA